MEFQTKIEIYESKVKVSHEDGILLLGSCFADNVGAMLERAKFNVLANPFGTLYNPLSIERLIEQAIEERQYTADCKEIFQHSGIYHSWMHHSLFDSPSAEELAERMNQARRNTTHMLKEGKTLIITLGTSIVYFLKESREVVANCHKMDDHLFERRMLKADEITRIWIELLRRLNEFNKRLQLIFTVSPIRHKRDGFHINQVSKGNLLLAVDQIQKEATFIDNAYFPSYEIMMDELRDYRFYDDDMIHPSPVAQKYIFQQFLNAHADRQTREIIQACEKIEKAGGHRNSGKDNYAYIKHIEKTLNQIEKTKEKYPFLNFEKEIQLCNTILKR